MKRGAGPYARAIERCWSAAMGRPVVLSPREWELVHGWYEREIPLALVVETIEQTVAAKSRGGARTPRGLGYIAPAVEESWSVVLEGRRAEEPQADRVREERVADAALESWRACLERAKPGSPLRALLGRLLERRAAGADPGELEAELDAALAGAVDPDLRTTAEREADRQLAGFATRMEPAQWAATRRRAIAARLRRRLGLAELALE